MQMYVESKSFAHSTVYQYIYKAGNVQLCISELQRDYYHSFGFVVFEDVYGAQNQPMLLM